MDRILDLKLQAGKDTLYTVLDAIEAKLIENGCRDSVKTEILIATEEIYMNIANYAYGGKTGEVVVQMEVSRSPRICRIAFQDKGSPYNPLDKEAPDISLSVEERDVGGLGIYMVKQSMDRVEYRYEDGSNILIFEKQLGY